MTVQSHEAQAIDAAQRLTDSLPAPPGETSAEASVSAQTPSMLPVTTEEVANAIQKDGISYIFEARSLTAVVRFVYTPIEGNFSDVEIEINNAEPIKVSEDGGVTIHMGGRNWAADDDGVERHFVSCEIVDDCVEARWQWKLDEELADFLYRIRLEGKSLLFEIEGGNGKATGIDLGYVSGAVHPRKLRVPYLNAGDDAPAILCTSGVFLSSYLDWFHTASSQLVGSHPGEDGRELRLNGGCTYLTASNGKRNNLQERWILTVSRQFEEVLPAIPQALPREGAEWLRGLVWYEIPRIDSTEEAYVDCYERLRTLRQWGMSELLVLHPDDIWHDGDGRTALGMTAAEAKGGDDALQEYLEAVSDLGFTCALPCSYAHVSKLDAIWEKESAALNADGSSATAGPNRHLLKPTRALGVARDHLGAMLEKYGARVALFGRKTVPLQRLGVVLRNTLAVLVHDAEAELSID